MFWAFRILSSLSWSSLRIGLPRLLSRAVLAPGVQPLRQFHFAPPPNGGEPVHPERLADLAVAGPRRKRLGEESPLQRLRLSSSCVLHLCLIVAVALLLGVQVVAGALVSDLANAELRD